MEDIQFQGSLMAVADGEVLGQVDFDLAESHPDAFRHRFVLAADTSWENIISEKMTTAEIIAIKAQHPFHITFEGGTASNKPVTVRGNMFVQMSGNTVKIRNETSILNEIQIFVAGA